MSPQRAAVEVIPYALWILSSGAALQRAATSVELLTKPEKVVFDAHVDTLVSLGLTYAHDQMDMQLEPPIHHLMPFAGVERPEVSSAVRMIGTLVCMLNLVC